MERHRILVPSIAGSNPAALASGLTARKEARKMTLPEMMVRYRAIHRISQGELAKRCGLSLQTVNSIENGLQDPSRVTEEKIRLVVEGDEKHD